MPLKALGEFAQVQEALDRALKAPGQPIKRGSMAHEHELYILLADTAAEMRDADGLAQYVGQAAALAERDDHRLYIGIARRARGIAERLAGDLDAARRSLAESAAIFEAQGMRWQLGRTYYELGELEQEAGEQAAARKAFSRALELFEQVGAKLNANKTRLALGE